MGVYFLRNKTTQNIKIGYTCTPSPKARLMGLQQSTDCELELLAFLPWAKRLVEKRLHAHFSADCVRGEWFRPSSALRLVVWSAKAGQLRQPWTVGPNVLTNGAVRAACARRIQGWSTKTIAKRFGVSEDEISEKTEVLLRRLWGRDWASLIESGP